MSKIIDHGRDETFEKAGALRKEKKPTYTVGSPTYRGSYTKGVLTSTELLTQNGDTAEMLIQL